MELHDIAGFVGVMLIVGTYLLLQVGWIKTAELRYSALNALGALLILLSLIVDFNLSAALVEGFWLLISVFGIVKNLKKN